MKNTVRLTRKQKNITQEELAKGVGISRPYLSDIENGKYSPGGVLMLKIAKFLNVKAEEIFFEDDVMHAEREKPDIMAG